MSMRTRLPCARPRHSGDPAHTNRVRDAAALMLHNARCPEGRDCAGITDVDYRRADHMLARLAAITREGQP